MVAEFQVQEGEKKARWTRKRALAAEPQWSDLQNAVFDWVESGEGNLRVGAVAGSGKSATLSAIVTRLPVDARVCILAFNKHIVESMKTKVPSRCGVFTAHGYGYGLLSRCFEGAPNVEPNKYRQIARDLIKPLDIKDLVPRQMAIAKCSEQVSKTAVIRGLVKDLCLLVSGCQATLTDGAIANLQKMIEFYGLTATIEFDRILPLVGRALSEGERLARVQKVVDYGDMLWLVHQWDLQSSKKDFVLIDETQDANNAQLSLYKRIGQDSRVVLVGDEKQSIMGFAFSSPDMWQKIQASFSTQTLPLSVCYRCPSSHLDLARYFVPEIQARDNAPIGEVGVIHPTQIKDMARDGDLILCRFTAPLVDLCLQMIVKGLNARVRGKDIGAQITGLVEQVCSAPDDWRNFAAVLQSFTFNACEKLQQQMKDEQADSLNDRALCLMACYEEFGTTCFSAAQFIKKIDDLFSDEDTKITLSTIHRAKGDEADRVFVLKSNALPYVPKNAQEWQLQQEENLAYVAITRAKQSMFFSPLGRDERETQALLSSPYGGMDVKPIEYEVSAPAEIEVKAEPKIYTPEQKEAIALIEQRFAAMANANLTLDPTVKIQNAPQLFTVPPKPEYVFEVGMLVALYHNPANPAKVLSIDGSSITVQRGCQESITVDRAKLKPLIPAVV